MMSVAGAADDDIRPGGADDRSRRRRWWRRRRWARHRSAVSTRHCWTAAVAGPGRTSSPPAAMSAAASSEQVLRHGRAPFDPQPGYPPAADSVPSQPPATAGMIETVWPSATAVSRPWEKRTSSSATKTLTKRRSWPSSSKRRSWKPGWAASRAARTSPTVVPSTFDLALASGQGAQLGGDADGGHSADLL